jgi:hypothetical protein
MWDQMKRFLPFVALTLLLLSACQTQRQRVEATKEVIQGVEWVAIAWVNSDEVSKIVAESLAQSGILSASEGSLIYAVEVPKADYVLAIKKLKQEPKLKGKWIRFN